MDLLAGSGTLEDPLKKKTMDAKQIKLFRFPGRALRPSALPPHGMARQPPDWNGPKSSQPWFPFRKRYPQVGISLFSRIESLPATFFSMSFPQ